MVMGALFENRCYTSNAEAADAFFSGSAPAFTAGSTSYLSWYEKVSGVWQIKRQSIAANGNISSLTSSIATVPFFPVCDPTEGLKDGLAVGWLVASAMILAAALLSLKRGAR